MKVLYFHQHFSTPKGGTGTRSYEFSKALIQKGHEVVMVCGSFDVGNTGLNGSFLDGRREGIVDGIKVIEMEMPYSNRQPFFKRALQFIKFAFKCIREVNKQRPDIVFCTSTPLTIALPGLFARWLKRKHFIFEVRDLWPELPVAMGVIKNPLIIAMLKAIEVIAYKSATKVIALSSGMADGVKKHIPSDRIETITNGCDLYLSSASSGKVILPKGINSDDFVAVYSGTHGIANGLHALIETARQLAETNNQHIKILLVGDGMVKETLKDKVKHFGLNNVFFLDNMPKEQLFNLYQYCHAGLMVLENIPAFYNGTSPNKFFDYIAAGLPVVCNYPGWIAGEIQEYKIGSCVNFGDSVQFANALVDLASHPSHTKTYSDNAKRLAAKKYDRNLLTQRFVKVIESVGGNTK